MVDSYICTIAIADDHLHMRQVVRQIIESFGYNIIIEAEDGQKLIDKIISGSVPDICVLDMNMPFLNGVQTTRILKERWPSIKIAIFSMSDRTWVRKEALAAGADVYILKLEPVETLRDALRALENKGR